MPQKDVVTTEAVPETLGPADKSMSPSTLIQATSTPLTSICSPNCPCKLKLASANRTKHCVNIAWMMMMSFPMRDIDGDESEDSDESDEDHVSCRNCNSQCKPWRGKILQPDAKNKIPLVLKEKVDYTVLVMSDLNTKLKLLEEEKQSLITALNILQVNEFKSNTQNPGQYVLANIQNEKSQPEQLEISSDSEYNIPLANRFSTLADEGKLNEDESEQTTQQQSTCNQSSEQCNSDVRVDNQQGQLREPASNEPPNNDNSKGTKQAEMAKTKGRIRPVDSRNSVNQGTSKSNSNNEMGSQGKSTLVIGDSMIKEIEVNKLSRSKKITKICMPGAKSDQIKERLQTTLKSTHYDEVIIHAGVNDLSNSQPDQIIVQLTDMAASVNSSTSIITTKDRNCKGWVYIDNSRIGNKHLKFNSIHLNQVGVK
ncbi:Hypothetical predicted protein [Paramuricea clavata]|uniref:Uncharacterized protein n=1 Tax=Paramuricea clavata TaxID=317549 RepID=A0A6S7H889_PARCT|nr:Hypothetical predicted protein [Paramuricea clavata]